MIRAHLAESIRQKMIDSAFNEVHHSAKAKIRAMRLVFLAAHPSVCQQGRDVVGPAGVHQFRNRTRRH